MSEQHVCEFEGCTSIETHHYHNGWADPEIVEWLCAEHAIEEGYCLWCMNYAAGSEDYDFSDYRGGHVGYHASCFQELRGEAGEFDEEDDEGWYDPYTDNWFDEDMDFENEESNGVDIGPGSEVQQ